MVEIVGTMEFIEWYGGLDEADMEQVTLHVDVPIRVFYVFDKKRQAVLLIGGDKTADESFYEKFTPRAEAIYARYQAEVAAEEGAPPGKRGKRGK